MASKDRLMLDSWRERRRTMAALKADAEVALPLLAAVRAEAEAAAQAVRDQFSDLPGFPPPCPRCLRSLVYRRVQLSRKNWRWMWFCRGGCGYSVYEAELQHQREGSNGRLPARVEEVLREAQSFQALVESLKTEFDDQVAAVTKALIEARKQLTSAEASRQQALASAAAAHAAAAAELDARQELFDALLRDKMRAFSLIGDAVAEWDLARASLVAEELEEKDRPALVAAEVLREWGREMAGLRRQLKVAEWVVKLYEFHFPWLTDMRDLDTEVDYVQQADESDEKEDPVARFVSKEEWAGLTSAERNQRALERYLRSRMTPWQLGRDYERYVGYLREQAGRAVTYHGIVKGFEDLGRDLLAEKEGTIEVIQCKRWAQHKEIHEKHIFQLFGTMIAARIENPSKSVVGTFTTTTKLSERAREFARVLEIKVEEGFPLADYPRIKCNIARRTDERIYHLPFDQQYDSTVVEPARGEHYVATAVEAEELGFRRAWRWRSETNWLIFALTRIERLLLLR